ncbi:MAG: hypothetical protein WKF43_13480 [Acidimicrobiales bacterium]
MEDTFGQPDKVTGSDPSEGVRIIGAKEAAEAMERGDVASRRGGDEPRYGDRPTRPPVGPRPVLRFPLEADADPTQIDRPAPRSPGPAPEAGGAAVPGRGQRFDPQLETTRAPLPAPGASAAGGDPVGGTIGSGPGDGASDDPTLQEPLEDPSAAGASPTSGDVGKPESLIRGAVEPKSESVELPHWSEPPTGEVPKVIAGDGGDDLDAWSSFTSSAPRWRDSEPDYEDDGFHEALGEDAGWRVGAMDDERPTHDEIYSFDEVDPVPTSGSSAAGNDDVEDTPGTDERKGRSKGRRTRLARRRPPARNPVAEYASGGARRPRVLVAEPATVPPPGATGPGATCPPR